jgi:hypothetical protein
MNLQFESIRIIGTKPEQVPDNHIVMNAPHPLSGDICWSGEFKKARGE